MSFYVSVWWIVVASLEWELLLLFLFCYSCTHVLTLVGAAATGGYEVFISRK